MIRCNHPGHFLFISTCEKKDAEIAKLKREVERLRAMYQAEYDNSQVLIGQVNELLRREKGYQLAKKSQ